MMTGFARKTWLFTLLITAACDEDPSGPTAIATSVEATDSPAATAVAGAVLTPSLSFSVKDQDGNVMVGVPVTITVTGGGTITNGPTQTTSGQTTVGTWTLGTTVGINTLSIKAGPLAPLTFSVSTVAGPPTQASVVSGAGQQALGGMPLPLPVTVKITDTFGNAVASTLVAFEVTAGEGMLASNAATTDANGLADVPVWTLGRIAIPQTVRATSGSAFIDVVAAVQTAFNIEVRFFGPPLTEEQEALFTRAAARLAATIPGDLPAVSATNFNLASACNLPGLPALNEVIDDVVIYASFAPIDGEKNILAQAGPCGFRTAASKFAPTVGVMQFDVADTAFLAAGGSLQDVITHEMLHVLGIGITWSVNNYLTGRNTPNVAYSGPAGRQGCIDSGGLTTCSISVPVANVGGAGSINAHWRESVFGRELMTPSLNTGSNPLSLITIGSLEDLGYVVNRVAADNYVVQSGFSALTSLQSEGSGLSQNWEKSREMPGAIFETNGSITYLGPKQ